MMPEAEYAELMDLAREAGEGSDTAAADLLARIRTSDAHAATHADGKTVNAWRCECCGFYTVGRHRDAGVTPFMLTCRAAFDPSTGKPCRGEARSLFYRISDAPAHPVAHVEFYRPHDTGELRTALASVKAEHRPWLVEHLVAGGCATRELPNERPRVPLPWGTRARQA